MSTSRGANGLDKPARIVPQPLLGHHDEPPAIRFHPGATHGFDRDLPTQVINDPFAHEGRGGPVTMAFNPSAARAARSALAEFFARNLA